MTVLTIQDLRYSNSNFFASSDSVHQYLWWPEYDLWISPYEFVPNFNPFDSRYLASFWEICKIIITFFLDNIFSAMGGSRTNWIWTSESGSQSPLPCHLAIVLERFSDHTYVMQVQPLREKECMKKNEILFCRMGDSTIVFWHFNYIFVPPLYVIISIFNNF